MTAINVAAAGKTLHIICDTAWCDESGILVSTQSPLIVMPESQTAIWAMARGETVAAVAADIAAGLFSDFDTMAKELPAALPSIVRRHHAVIEHDNWIPGSSGIYILGWSRALQRAKALRISAIEGRQPVRLPLTFPISRSAFDGVGIKLRNAARSLMVTAVPTIEGFGQSAALRFEMLKLQRAFKVGGGRYKKAHRIGGQAIFCQIGPTIATQVLHDFGDRIGRTITPTLD